MKNRLLLISLLMICTNTLKSQEENTDNESKRGSEIGFHLSQYQDDFGFGLDYTSPFLLKKKYLAFTFRTNRMYFEHIDNLETVWTPYYSLQLGVIGSKTEVTKNVILYGEGGLIAVIPNSKFSTSDIHIGGYGLFGFQFNFDNHNAYFIELGGIGIDARADKLPLEPIYSNGFLINVGYKVIF